MIYNIKEDGDIFQVYSPSFSFYVNFNLILEKMTVFDAK